MKWKFWERENPLESILHDAQIGELKPGCTYAMVYNKRSISRAVVMAIPPKTGIVLKIGVYGNPRDAAAIYLLKESESEPWEGVVR